MTEPLIGDDDSVNGISQLLWWCACGFFQISLTCLKQGKMVKFALLLQSLHLPSGYIYPRGRLVRGIRWDILGLSLVLNLYHVWLMVKIYSRTNLYRINLYYQQNMV